MSKLFYDEETFLENNIFKYEERIHSPVIRMQNRSMQLCTYWHLVDGETTTDEGFQDVQHLVGKESPFRFHKIENFPLYEMDQIQLELSDNEQGLDVGHQGDATILPNTIKPVPNSFFCINHVGTMYIFRVIGVSIDTIMSDNYYKINYQLEYTHSDERLDGLDEQTTETYTCIIDNIGTEKNCLIETKKLRKIEEIDEMVDNLKELYISLFYNDRYNCFIGETDDGNYLYDPFQSYFINQHGLFNKKKQMRTFILNIECVDDKFPLKYQRSVYKYLENPIKFRCLPFNFVTFMGQSRVESNFYRWLDCKVRVVDIAKYMDPMKTKHIFSQNFLTAVFDNIKLDNPYAELVRSYIQNKTVDLENIPLDLYEEIVNSDANEEVFFFVPIVLYIIQVSIDAFIRIKK